MWYVRTYMYGIEKGRKVTESSKDENRLTHFAQDRSCRDIRFYKIYLNSMLLLCDDIQELSKRRRWGNLPSWNIAFPLDTF